MNKFLPFYGKVTLQTHKLQVLYFLPSLAALKQQQQRQQQSRTSICWEHTLVLFSSLVSQRETFMELQTLLSFWGTESLSLAFLPPWRFPADGSLWLEALGLEGLTAAPASPVLWPCQDESLQFREQLDERSTRWYSQVLSLPSICLAVIRGDARMGFVWPPLPLHLAAKADAQQGSSCCADSNCLSTR